MTARIEQRLVLVLYAACSGSIEHQRIALDARRSLCLQWDMLRAGVLQMSLCSSVCPSHLISPYLHDSGLLTVNCHYRIPMLSPLMRVLTL